MKNEILDYVGLFLCSSPPPFWIRNCHGFSVNSPSSHLSCPRIVLKYKLHGIRYVYNTIRGEILVVDFATYVHRRVPRIFRSHCGYREHRTYYDRFPRSIIDALARNVSVGPSVFSRNRSTTKYRTFRVGKIFGKFPFRR